MPPACADHASWQGCWETVDLNEAGAVIMSARLSAGRMEFAGSRLGGPRFRGKICGRHL